MNPELIKLIIIIVIGVLVLLVGFIIQKKKHEKEFINNDENLSNISTSIKPLTLQEENAKKYIETYKSQYSKESISQALIKSGNDETEVNNWINKYF